MSKQLEPKYNHHKVEEGKYRKWIEKNVKFTLEEDGSLLDTVVAEGAHGEISDDKLKDTEALFDKNDY